MKAKIVPYRAPKNNIEKLKLYAKHQGLAKAARMVWSKVTHKDPLDQAYERYLEKNKLTAQELKRQREYQFKDQPLISIVVPLYKTPEKFLVELIQSVISQTYGNWELVLADGSPDNSLFKLVEEQKMAGPAEDTGKRIRYEFIGKNLGISENTNRAIAIAGGEFIAFCDHDDLLTEDALFEVVSVINENANADCIYSDEDYLNNATGKLVKPHFKSDFNMDLLCSHNYITHLFVCRAELVKKLGGLRSDFDGSQDHDFILRACEKAKGIYHIPKVLYHWRAHSMSTAENIDEKLYAQDAGVKAVWEHFDRIGIPVQVKKDWHGGFYKTSYKWPDKVSADIVFVNDDHRRLTARELNEAVRQTSGELILFMDSRAYQINEDAISLLGDLARRPDVGAVGPRMFFGNNTVSHGGLVVGLGGLVACPFKGDGREQVGYNFRGTTVQDVSAVSSDCMMTSRKAFTAVGGFDEGYETELYDVDYCLRLQMKGFLTVYNPDSQWYYLEEGAKKSRPSAYRSYKELSKEEKYFADRWATVLEEGDPYYNKNFRKDIPGYRL